MREAGLLDYLESALEPQQQEQQDSDSDCERGLTSQSDDSTDTRQLRRKLHLSHHAALANRHYPVRFIIHAIQVLNKLKNRDDFAKVIMCSLKALSVGTGNAEMTRQVEHAWANLRKPNGRLVQEWRIKMDSYLMLYNRHLAARGMFKDVFHYLGADSSPQMGHDYFILREERARFVPAIGEHAELPDVTVQSVTLPVTTIGWANATVEAKIVRIHHVLTLNYGDSLDEYRHTVYGAYSDQGVERGCGNMLNWFGSDRERCCDVIARLRSGELEVNSLEVDLAHFFPNLWDFTGHLHINNSALKKAITSHPHWKDLESAIRCISRFLSTQGLRKRFREFCCKTYLQKQRMKHWSGAVFNWRWEELEGILHQLLEGGMLQILIDCFDMQMLMEGKHDSDDETSVLLSSLGAALKLEHLNVRLHQIYAVCRSMGQECRWQEGCKCHEHILMQCSTSFERRKALLKAGVAEGHCPWQGRRVVENVCGHVEETARSFRDAAPSELSALYASMPEKQRGQFLLVEDKMKSVLIEEYLAKYKFYSGYPALLLRCLCLYFGKGSWKDSRSHLGSSLRWYDEISNKGECHRAIRMFFVQGSLRADTELYLRGSAPLHFSPVSSHS